jgi:hypothetical protein
VVVLCVSLVEDFDEIKWNGIRSDEIRTETTVVGTVRKSGDKYLLSSPVPSLMTSSILSNSPFSLALLSHSSLLTRFSLLSLMSCVVLQSHHNPLLISHPLLSPSPILSPSPHLTSCPCSPLLSSTHLTHHIPYKVLHSPLNNLTTLNNHIFIYFSIITTTITSSEHVQKPDSTYINAPAASAASCTCKHSSSGGSV